MIYSLNTHTYILPLMPMHQHPALTGACTNMRHPEARPWEPGPCLTTTIWHCRNPFSQWERSFQRKLRSHWLKFLRQCHIAGVRQGPGVSLVFTNLTFLGHFTAVFHIVLHLSACDIWLCIYVHILYMYKLSRAQLDSMSGEYLMPGDMGPVNLSEESTHTWMWVVNFLLWWFSATIEHSFFVYSLAVVHVDFVCQWNMYNGRIAHELPFQGLTDYEVEDEYIPTKRKILTFLDIPKFFHLLFCLFGWEMKILLCSWNSVCKMTAVSKLAS